MAPNYFSKRQQLSVLILFLVIGIFQFIILIWPVGSSSPDFEVLSEGKNFQERYKALTQNVLHKSDVKTFPFNPNLMSPYRAYTLGLSNKEYDRLVKYRNRNLWINTAKEFQNITQISDSLLNIISPNFKFPNWASQPSFKKSNSEQPLSKSDINKATATELQKIRGIGPVLSNRIIQYRDRHVGGFSDMVELSAIYGLQNDLIEKIKKHFIIKTPRLITKININTASQEELVKIPYIDYEIAYAIIEFRTIHEEFKSLNELTKLKDFPNERLEIIKLYLSLNFSE